MAYTVTFPSRGPVPSTDAVAEWLTERGEPFDPEGPHAFQLRALPIRVVNEPEDSLLKAHIEVTPQMPLERLVDVVFALSVRAGADVRLAGAGALSRSALWMRLADEQDRLRLAQALERADEQGKKEEVVQRLWQILATVSPGHDIRWDATRERIVELKEVDEPGGIALADAAWLVEDPEAGDVVPVPMEGPLHILGWRWLSEAHPGLADH